MSPYVSKERREAIDNCGADIEGPGDLTYLLTCIVADYLLLHGESFQTYAEILGALEATKLELYRRKIGRYEDKKLLESGDVY